MNNKNEEFQTSHRFQTFSNTLLICLKFTTKIEWNDRFLSSTLDSLVFRARRDHALFFSHKRNDKIQSTIFPWRRPRCHVSGAATAPVSGSARDREAALGFWVDERGYAARWGRLVTDSLRASRRRRHLCAFAPPLSNNRDPFDTPTPTS